MSTVLSRRNLILSSGVAAAAIALSGCTTSRDGTTSKISLDTDKIGKYAQAGINAANMVIDVLALIPGLTKLSDPLAEVAANIKVNLDAFLAAAGPKVEVVYNDASIQTKVDSILSNLERLIGLIDSAKDAIKATTGIDVSGIIGKVEVVFSAIKTITSILSLLIGGVVNTASSGVGGLSESQALQVLGVK